MNITFSKYERIIFNIIAIVIIIIVVNILDGFTNKDMNSDLQDHIEALITPENIVEEEKKTQSVYDDKILYQVENFCSDADDLGMGQVNFDLSNNEMIEIKGYLENDALVLSHTTSFYIVPEVEAISPIVDTDLLYLDMTNVSVDVLGKLSTNQFITIRGLAYYEEAQIWILPYEIIDELGEKLILKQ